MLEINAEGITIIKDEEKLRLSAYWDDIGKVWTIGYGHTRTAHPRMMITPSQAETLFREDIGITERALRGSLAPFNLNVNEWSALVSLAFNVGVGAVTFPNLSIYKALQHGDKQAAADAIELWNKGGPPGKKIMLGGLTRRRAREKALFLKPVG